ncbi:LOW QUALITY PROTEIN: hypothetical protein OSB04_004506 [Centaurea solstitialis]|uniref:RecQ-mediated genome instability protein 1 n=1 Tax=Centaurea solstitialis TaxID=347529 RepID=A0AA38U8J5_9ASTR|nr:LOW QUALITY PROTEIN: hypothetical protein OSB04_004506 [Centaurea solstitialis]
MSSRRRLRIITSSDEEEEEDDDELVTEVQPPPPPPQQQHNDNNSNNIEIDCETLNLQDVTLSSSNSTTNPTNQSDYIHLDTLSDEDFLDAFEHLEPSPPQPSEHSRSSGVGSTGGEAASDSPVARVLEGLGLRLRSEWLDSCLVGLRNAVPGFSGFDDAKKAKLCFERFLLFDMNKCGVLPNNVHRMHLVDLPGPFVLQVDEIVNISQPLRERYKKSSSGLKRCLKLSMTDGVQRVFGMEYQPIKDLEALAPAGLKYCRTIKLINVVVSAECDHGLCPYLLRVAISNVHVRHGILMLVPEVFQVLGGLVEELDAARQRLVTEVNKPPRGKRTRTGVVPPLATRATRAAWPAEEIHVSAPINNPVPQRASPMQVDDRGSGSTPASVSGRVSSNSAVPVHREHVGHHLPRNEVESAVPTRRENIEPCPSNSAEESSAAMHMETESFAVPIPRESVDTTLLREEPIIPLQREHAESFPSPIVLSDDGDTHMAPAENHSTLRSSEIPFTYLASLSAKWAASKDKASHVEGKIKCILTGVKGFQYKEGAHMSFSLISEILVDHNVVQKKIGYSPEEVATALSCSNPSRVQEMKDRMKQFRGMMLIRMNEASTLPVATEMHQGCPPSDAWLLLSRLKSSNDDQEPQGRQLDPINLSP